MAKKTYNYVGDLFQMLYNKTIDEAKNLLGNDWTLKKTYDDDDDTRYFYFVSGDKKEDGEEEFLILLTGLKGKEHKNYYVYDVWTNTNEPYLVKTHELNEAETNMSISAKGFKFPNSNLYFHGTKHNVNGNKVLQFSFSGGRKFSIYPSAFGYYNTIYFSKGDDFNEFAKDHFGSVENFEKQIVSYIVNRGTEMQKNELYYDADKIDVADIQFSMIKKENYSYNWTKDKKFAVIKYNKNFPKEDCVNALVKLRRIMDNSHIKLSILTDGNDNYNGIILDADEEWGELREWEINRYAEEFAEIIGYDSNFACGKGNFDLMGLNERATNPRVLFEDTKDQITIFKQKGKSLYWDKKWLFEDDGTCGYYAERTPFGTNEVDYHNGIMRSFEKRGNVIFSSHRTPTEIWFMEGMTSSPKRQILFNLPKKEITFYYNGEKKMDTEKYKTRNVDSIMEDCCKKNPDFCKLVDFAKIENHNITNLGANMAKKPTHKEILNKVQKKAINIKELDNNEFSIIDDTKDVLRAGGKGNFSVKEQKVVAFVWNKKSLNSSYYGNPRYLVDLRVKGGDMWYDCKTSSDGRLSYNNFQKGMLGEFTYHETANGNVILDDFKTIPMFKKGDVVKVKWENGWHKIKEVVLSQSRAENGNEADYVLDNGKSVREWLIEGKRGVGSKFIKKDDIISNFSIIDDIFSGGILMF